jgi:hypothetical protein
VNPHHLRWATPTENMADMLDHGTRPRGEAHYRSKLTDDAVRQIRASTEEQSILARRYGVSQPLISNIRSGAGWKHVTP